MARMLESYHGALGRGPLEAPRTQPEERRHTGMHPGELAEASMREDLADDVVHRMAVLVRETQSPLHRVESGVGPWSAFVVVPIFALANAGIALTGEAIADALRSNVAWGVALGLLVGKLVGVLLFTYLTVRLGISQLPAGVRWSHVGGVALLSGIGFTVSIFIATLSFDHAYLVEEAKIGIFAATIIAAVLGFLALRLLAPSHSDDVLDGDINAL